ncbi:MAG: ATP-dependent zinc metalloprotease FtsH [Leptolyngbya sp. SIO4C1]|nr:ATP-dependent zinc metalloprotease FtsH [Leptolyngbya sp. SIO4C1]
MPVETRDRTPQQPDPKQVGRGFLYLLLYLLLFNWIVLPLLRPGPKETAYSQFLAQVEAGEVERAQIQADKIRYSLKPDEAAAEPSDATSDAASDADAEAAEDEIYTTTPVPGNFDLVEFLVDNGVAFEAPPPDRFGWLGTLLSWVAPPLIFVGLWVWLLGRAQGGASAALTVGKSKARIYAEGDTGVTFDDVAGVDEAKTELQEIIEFLKHPDKYTRIGAVIPKGVLLIGPPGTGKTLMARAVAGEAGVPFFSISGAEFIELFVGVGAARVRDLFRQAKQQAPCIVFIDELDALGKARRNAGSLAGGNDEQEQTLNQLLTEMDGFEPNAGVIIVAATNRPEVLDPALRRPGRFDRQVVVDRPDKLGRKSILQVHASKIQLAEDVDLDKIAARTPGFAGADLANLINEAALLAARQDHDRVHMADLSEAIERVVAGLERKSRVLNPEEKRVVAYHEVGHAIIGSIMPGANKVEKISIVPRGVGALGYTLQLPEEDRFLMAEDELRGRIATLLGGRSAEETVFQKVSTGASDDIQKVTDLAERMVTLYGMETKLGPVAFERVQQQFLEGWQNARRPISPEVSAVIDQAVQTIVEGAHTVALSILAENRALLEEMAQHLLEQEVLEGEPLRAFLGRVAAPSGLQSWLTEGKLTDQMA